MARNNPFYIKLTDSEMLIDEVEKLINFMTVFTPILEKPPKKV